MGKLDGVRDVIKSAKHRRPEQIYCPRCCSPKIHLTSSLNVWLTPKNYYCEDCGYVGIVVMELEKDDSQTEGKTKKEESEP
jgi:late competence protein required for DNA uptake (superfamily II DNA/RNA helicase)